MHSSHVWLGKSAIIQKRNKAYVAPQ